MLQKMPKNSKTVIMQENAIEKNGTINMNECFYCLDCQSLYYDEHKCPPLVIIRKKNVQNVIPQNKPARI